MARAEREEFKGIRNKVRVGLRCGRGMDEIMGTSRLPHPKTGMVIRD